MPRLPQISGRDLIQALRGFGYEQVRQKGSHIRLRKQTATGEHSITVPDHSVVAKGTLNDILKSVSAWHGISRDKLMGELGLLW
jgi:predicted RNA binding protein YcfA (HicA-like mRNA interferase family)